MGAYSQLRAPLPCPSCRTVSEVEVQSKHGSVVHHRYRLYDTLRWGARDVGPPTAAHVVADAEVAGCPACDHDGDWPAYVFLDHNRLTAATNATGAHDFRAADTSFLLLDPPASLRLTAWPSAPALLADLDAVILDAEAPDRFHSCAIARGADTLAIGIATPRHALVPTALPLAHGRVVLVGHDSSLSWIDVDQRALTAHLDLPCVFFAFLPVGDDVLAIHELGAVRVDARGHQRWSVATDIVGDFRLDGAGRLLLSQWEDSLTHVISLDTGAVEVEAIVRRSPPIDDRS